MNHSKHCGLESSALAFSVSGKDWVETKAEQTEWNVLQRKAQC